MLIVPVDRLRNAEVSGIMMLLSSAKFINRVWSMFHRSNLNSFAFATILLVVPGVVSAQQSLSFDAPWQRSGAAPAREIFEFSGTGNRNNPLRRRLAKPFSGDELFVRFRLRYDAKSIDTVAQGDGEFFVMWLDQVEGTDNATHSAGVPNLGVHVADGQNRFMVRFSSSGQKFTKTQLVGDREFRIVGRLWKSRPGKDQLFDSLDIWIDPGPEEEFKPHASAVSRKSLSRVSWIGFSTGRKTEPTDRIQVSDVGLASDWFAAIGLPPKPTLPPKPSGKPVELAKQMLDFKSDVFPLLKDRCFQCHAGEEADSGVRLDVWDEVLNQVSPRNASQSRLIQLLATEDLDQRMPPADEGNPLSDHEIAVLSTWIDEGVAWDEQLLPTPQPQSEHWAFQPIRRPGIPEVAREKWVRTPGDAFIARRQEELGIEPVSTASTETIARRVCLDLVGLPPSVAAGRIANPSRGDERTAGRIGNPSGSDYHKLIEQLLASPHYGERWGRHWLDVARWAESNGHQHNRDRPHAWRYRDYVVESFNSNKPFDQFIREQVAGDQLPDSQQQTVATGFLAAARYSGNELDKEIQRNDILVDVANTTAKAFLGLTMECAQCHTHKFDPISIRDYYRFQAFFAKGQPQNIVLAANNKETQSLIEARWRIFDAVHQRLVQSRRKRGFPEPILVIPKNVLSEMSKDERQQFDQLEAKIAKLPKSWAWYSPSTATDRPTVAPHAMRWPLPQDPHLLASQKTYLRPRGDAKSRGPEVEPGWPIVFGSTPDKIEQPRRALEIGTGCGYQTAILAKLARRVYTIERHKPLLERAEKTLDALKVRNVTAIAADGMQGWPTIHGRNPAPFDKIIVTAAARDEPPQALLDQLKIGGLLVIPVAVNGEQVLRRYKKESEDTFAHKDLMPVRFVPLLPEVA